MLSVGKYGCNLGLHYILWTTRINIRQYGCNLGPHYILWPTRIDIRQYTDASYGELTECILSGFKRKF